MRDEALCRRWRRQPHSSFSSLSLPRCLSLPPLCLSFCPMFSPPPIHSLRAVPFLCTHPPSFAWLASFWLITSRLDCDSFFCQMRKHPNLCEHTWDSLLRTLALPKKAHTHAHRPLVVVLVRSLLPPPQSLPSRRRHLGLLATGGRREFFREARHLFPPHTHTRETITCSLQNFA